MLPHFSAAKYREDLPNLSSAEESVSASSGASTPRDTGDQADIEGVQF